MLENFSKMRLFSNILENFRGFSFEYLSHYGSLSLSFRENMEVKTSVFWKLWKFGASKSGKYGTLISIVFTKHRRRIFL